MDSDNPIQVFGGLRIIRPEPATPPPPLSILETVAVVTKYFYNIERYILIWNRQKKRSFLVCGAAAKSYFIEPQRAAVKPSERGFAPEPGGGGGSPPDLPPGAFAPWTQQLSAIWLPLLGRKIRTFFFLFQIEYRMYLSSQTVYTRMQFYRLSRRRGR